MRRNGTRSELLTPAQPDVDRPLHASRRLSFPAQRYSARGRTSFRRSTIIDTDGEIGLTSPVEHCGVDRSIPRPAHRCLLRLRGRGTGRRAVRRRSVTVPFSSAVSVGERGDKGVGVELGHHRRSAGPVTHMPSIINGASSMTSFCRGANRGRMRVVRNAQEHFAASAHASGGLTFPLRDRWHGASWMVGFRARAPGQARRRSGPPAPGEG